MKSPLPGTTVENTGLARSLPGAGPLGLYVHVPFCSSTCGFCAFDQAKPARGDFDLFIEGIERELDLVAIDRPVDTVFWGGGTPGLLPAEALSRLGGTIKNRLKQPPVEWTVEMTPGSVRESRLEALGQIGVTRISLGAQSFQPRLLEALGRLHPRERIYSACAMIRKAGFANLNLDLIFAIPGQTLEEWLSDLREAVELGPEHISTYCLTFEEDTALYVKLSRGRVKIDTGLEVAFLKEAGRFLESAGFQQYEISNYSRPGYRCIHNLNTWKMASWIGLGPSAASQYEGWRGSNPAGLEPWLEGLRVGRRASEERVPLEPGLLAADKLIFGLRMNEGVDPEEIEKETGHEFPLELNQRLDQWEKDGLLWRAGGRIALTPRGRLVADRMGAELLEIGPNAG